MFDLIAIKNFAKVGAGQGAPQIENEFSDEGYPFIRAGHLDDLIAGKNELELPKINLKVANKYKLKLYQPNTVIFAKSGMSATKGRIYKLSNPSYIVNHLATLKLDDNVYPDYIVYSLKKVSPVNLIKDPAYPSISQADIENLKIPIPPLLDQIKIATVLRKAEVLIKQRKENIDLLNEFLKSTFLKMFGEPMKNTSSWVTLKFGDCLSQILSGSSSTNKVPENNEEARKAKILKVSSVTWGEFNPDEYKLISWSQLGHKLVHPEEGDLLFSRANTKELVGATCIVDKNYPDLFLPDKLWVLFLNNRANQYYIHFLFQDEQFKKILTKDATGSSGSMLNISMEKLRNIIIPLPPIEIQEEFKKITLKAWELKEHFKNNLMELENLFVSLSQRVFKGELDLSGLEFDHIIPVSKGGSHDISNLQVISKKENIIKEDKLPISLEELHKNYRKLAVKEAFKVLKNRDDAEDVVSELLQKIYDRLRNHPIEYLQKYIAKAAKYAASSFKEKRNIDSSPFELFPEDFDFLEAIPDEKEKEKKGEILWEKVSIQQVSNWISEKYSGHHFNSEMLLRFLKEEQLTTPNYFSSEELKKYPKLNSLDDLHTIIFSALDGENPYLKLKQVFYNGTKEHFSLNLLKEDIEFTSGKSDEQMIGVYFTIE